MPKLNKIFTLEITPELFLNNCSPTELREIDTLIQSMYYLRRMNSRECRECGCTEYNCQNCVDRTGEPCHWVEADLCSACAKINEIAIEQVENRNGSINNLEK